MTATSDEAPGAPIAAADDAEHDGAVPGAAPRSRFRWHKVALGITVLMVILVVAALPFALRSIYQELTNAEGNVLYDLATGEPLTAASAGEAADEITYANISVTAIDPAAGTATIAVSGHRVCPKICPALTVSLLAMGNDAHYRRGLPPSASFQLEGKSALFNQTVELPVQGSPVLYPFDNYRLVLGLVARINGPNGAGLTLSPQNLVALQGRTLVTIQDQTSQLLMAPPRRIDPQSVTAPTDPFVPQIVQELRFERAEYLKVLCMLLIALMTVSGALALFTRTIDDLLLGIGGLILGVWGIRSVLVPQPLPTISAVDLALSGIILFLLLGLAVRAARHFQQQARLHGG